MNPSEEVRCQFSRCGPGGWTHPGHLTSSWSPGSWGAARGGQERPRHPQWVLPARVLPGPPGLLSANAHRAGPGVPVRWPRQLAAEQKACRRGQPCSRGRATGPVGSGRGLAGVWARARCGHLSAAALLLGGLGYGEGVTQDGELVLINFHFPPRGARPNRESWTSGLSRHHPSLQHLWVTRGRWRARDIRPGR